MKVIHVFYSFQKFEKNLNVTFISLIPKKAEDLDVKDYYSINLVHGVYDIISKVLANHVIMVMEKIISKSANAFVKVRQF